MRIISCKYLSAPAGPELCVVDGSFIMGLCLLIDYGALCKNPVIAIYLMDSHLNNPLTYFYCYYTLYITCICGFNH